MTILRRLAGVLLLAAGAAAADVALALRGYGPLRWEAPAPGGPALHRFTLASPALAARFASKVLADYELTAGNRIRPGPHGGDLVELAAGGLIVPLASAASSEVLVLAAADERALAQALPRGAWLRRADLRHPDWLDKWDRHCLGMWQGIGDFAQDDRNKTLDSFYGWFGAIGLNVQINRGSSAQDLAVNGNPTDYLLSFFARHGVRYQQIEWLPNQPDLYNRNAFLAAVPNPAVASRSHYYGERFLLGNPLRQVQDANAWNWMRQTAGDDRQVAMLDPDGEIGPFEFDRWGLHGPMAQREFVRFLREVRGLDLAGASRRYRGDAAAFRSWEEVPLADWREFYGFTAGAIDLAGEWRFQRDDARVGLAQGWAGPGFDDGDWVRLHYPGDALAFGLPKAGSPLWMRRTIAVPPGAGPYLTVALLTSKPAQVFIDGELAGTLAPRFHTANTVGQFPLPAAPAGRRTLTVALRLAGGDPPQGPVFITPRKMEEFPTADPQVNARRFDHLEFTDWAIAQAMGGTLATLRSIDADKAIKVHAYGGSPWGWAMVARYGGYSHHTGSGAGWHWDEPKRYGAARGLQDSSEPGGPMGSLRDLKGLWGNLVSMGKNAHDYFINLQSITRDPAMRAYFEAKIPEIKVMGRANVLLSPVAVMRGKLNGLYEGEFMRWEDWRHGVDAARGGEVVPLLDEVRVREGGLSAYRAIIDEGTRGWDAPMAAALRAYVEGGGVLLLNNQSGRHDFIGRDHLPGPELAGVVLGAPVAGGAIASAGGDPALPGLPATIRTGERLGETARRLQPGAGVAVLGTWPDGSPALVRRSLGRGAVFYHGGSTFPQELIQAVAAAYGPAIRASAVHADLVRTLRSNNGCEDLLMVRGVGGKPVTVTWDLETEPREVYDPVTGRSVAAAISGTRATFTAAIDDWDFAWFAVRRPGPDAQFRHWLHRQTEIWSGTATGARPGFPGFFRHLDLNRGWKLARTATWDEAAALVADDGGRLKPSPLILWDAPGMADGGPCGLYRRDFTLPEGWERGNDLHLSLRGQVHDAPLHGFQGRNAIRLNGTEIWAGGRADTLRLDVSALVRPGANRLEIIHQGPGVMLSIMLVRTLRPDAVIDLAGPWRAVRGLNQEEERMVPGTGKCAFLYRELVVPAERKHQEVWLHAEGRFPFAIINGRLRYWDLDGGLRHAPEPGLAIDITPDIRWGASNRIVLGTRQAMDGWAQGEQACGGATLAFYAPGRWSGGAGIRGALTARELAEVARDLGAVVSLPLVHAAATRAALADDRPDPATAVPAPAIDLALGEEGAVAADRGPGRVEVGIEGAAEPFCEAGGRIRGVILHADATRTASLRLPPAPLRAAFAGGDATLRAWVKPVANDRAGGALFSWGSWYLGWNLDDEACSVGVVQGGRLDGEALLRQRRWQSLTLVTSGTRASLYVDGMPAAQAVWPVALTGVDAPGFIGSDGMKRSFLNARLAAFSVWPQALDARQVRQVFLAERERFRAAPGDPADDWFRLAIDTDGAHDASEIPAALALGPGVTVGEEGGRRHLAFSGTSSWLLPVDHARSKLFCSPFTLVAELRTEPGAEGMILRRHHAICLFIERNGDLVLDANIGRPRQMCRFPGVFRQGGWTRFALAYDGATVRLRVGDAPAEVRDYPASIFPCHSDFPVSLFADNTRGKDRKAPQALNLPCQVRELRILPGMPLE